MTKYGVAVMSEQMLEKLSKVFSFCDIEILQDDSYIKDIPELVSEQTYDLVFIIVDQVDYENDGPDEMNTEFLLALKEIVNGPGKPRVILVTKDNIETALDDPLIQGAIQLGCYDIYLEGEINAKQIKRDLAETPSMENVADITNPNAKLTINGDTIDIFQSKKKNKKKFGSFLSSLKKDKLNVEETNPSPEEDFQAEAVQASHELQMALEDLEKSKKEVLALNDLNSELSQKHEDTLIELDECRRKIQRLENEVRNESNESNDRELLVEIEKLRNELASLQKKYSALDELSNSQVLELQRAQNELKSMKNVSNNEMNQKTEVFQFSKDEVLNSDFPQLIKKIEELSIELGKSRQPNDENNTDVNEQKEYHEEIYRLETELERLKNSDVNSDVEKELANQISKNGELEAQVSELERKLQLRSESVPNSDNEVIKALKDQNKLLNEELKAKEEELRNLL